MNRRSFFPALAGLLGAAGAVSTVRAQAPAAAGAGPIVLYCDLAVDPAREQEMLQAFRTVFKPTAQRHKGYIDLKMLKLRTVLQGGPKPPPGVNYRFQLTYENEDLRQNWVKSDDHQRVWPLIENTVLNKDYIVLLTDSV
ncbi:hypothetical protein [Phenylobacterium deserti]|uniref:Dabb family protein n=1 Tax=Phenylobacterium deserti TaxID=1914756 RepID=A0A328A8C7_9CAUL|nr:hypothetical protein [Phenylobacterium deserti]RAK50771.1 hypothetical protein DJ018_18690 [Phenylobacterium deserti]